MCLLKNSLKAALTRKLRDGLIALMVMLSASVTAFATTGAVVGQKTITFALPDNAPSEVSWEALPHPSNNGMALDVWAPHETTPRIQAELPLGRWTVIAHGFGESEYRADLNITDAWDNDLTIILPFNNTMGGDGMETDPSIAEASSALVNTLKATLIDVQTRQATGEVIAETNADVQRFMQSAKNKLGDGDYQEIDTLLSLMGKSFAKTLGAWRSAKTQLLMQAPPENTAANTAESQLFSCQIKPACPYSNAAFGIQQLAVPYGWGISDAYFYATAAGAKAKKATVIFTRLRDNVMVSLNQRQASGKCLDTRSGRLCYFTEDNINADELMLIIEGAN